jgi:lycopene cyclase domain-containing protein
MGGQYLGALAACVAITVPLEVLGARVYRRPLRLAASVLPAAAVFAVWDLVAARRSHWWWSADQVIGVRLIGLPIEEWLFFLVIPVCAVLTYEALGRRIATRRPATVRRPGDRASATAGHGR